MRVFERFSPRYLVPNAVTCTSLVLGLGSVYTSMTATTQASFVDAAWLIMWAVLLDKLDGTVARRLKATSDIGVQLDSFSDFTTFGIAPAALVSRFIAWATPERCAHGTLHVVLVGFCASYAVAAAVRLARFNITTAITDPRFFLGLPSTSSGGLLAVAYLSHTQLSLPVAWLQGLLGMLVVCGVLMVSNLPQPKLKMSTVPWRKAVQVVVVVSVYVFVPLRMHPTYMLVAAMMYTLGGFAYGLAVAPDPTDART